MNTTISENDDVLALRQKVNKYLASVDELTKLADKERESADALIAALLAENEKLRAFIAAYGLWLEGEIDRVSTNAVEMNNMQDAVKSVALVHVSANFNRLKAQHLGDDSKGE